MIGDGLAHLSGGEFATEVAGAVAGGQGSLDCGAHHGGGGRDAKMVEHHGGTEDGCDRIGDALAGDVGRGAVDRFEHRRERSLRVDVAAGGETESSSDDAAEVGQEIAEQVGQIGRAHV